MALRLAPAQAGGAAMTDAVRPLLRVTRFRAQAQRVKALFAPIDGAANAATAIRAYLAQREGGALRAAA
jgi:hypothetical protein